jgi:hypothetical protein
LFASQSRPRPPASDDRAEPNSELIPTKAAKVKRAMREVFMADTSLLRVNFQEGTCRASLQKYVSLITLTSGGLHVELAVPINLATSV